MAVSILVYSVCNSLIASEEGRVSGVQSGVVNTFCISSNCRYNAFTVCTKGYIVSFLPTTQIRLYACFDLFSFSVSNSETDGWIFMLIAHGKAPFVLAVAAGVTDNLTATGIYSL